MSVGAFSVADIERRLANLIRFGTIEQLDEENALARVRCGEILTDWLSWRTNRAGPDRDWWALEPGEQVILLAPSGELNQAVIVGSINRDLFPAPGNRKTLHRIQYQDGTTKDYDRAASIDTATYPDGTVIQYNATASLYTIKTSSGTEITVNAGSGDVTADIEGSLTAQVANTITAEAGDAANIAAPSVNITGNVTITGSLTLAGPLSAAPGSSGSGVSLQGNMQITSGDITADGVSLKSHTHPGDSGGNTGNPN
ncbi:phage baseplate assembly protein V [Marinobacter adhaerens]|uniref:phage baseplate assembly protein V n=1 Tax=Marinobacter adhaerens TaxID=1033846 RepID=UPI003D26C592